jgi:phosphomannomutase
VDPAVLVRLAELRKKVVVGMVGGSDLPKQIEQLGEGVLGIFDYTFSENGLHAFKDGVQFHRASIKEFLGYEKIKLFVNFTLKYIADLDIPVKTGTFIEFRAGMMNVSPVGRNCSQEERDAFEVYCGANNVRPAMVEALRAKFPDYGLQYSIGGQISFDVFPMGWDKTYCLQFLEEFATVHFFGDKTYKGGNDHEIFESERTVGHTVTSPADTVRILDELFP